MPVILPEEHHDAWLFGEAGKEILVPYPADRMKAWPISPRVNSPKSNDAEIIVPGAATGSGESLATRSNALPLQNPFDKTEDAR